MYTHTNSFTILSAQTLSHYNICVCVQYVCFYTFNTCVVYYRNLYNRTSVVISRGNADGSSAIISRLERRTALGTGRGIVVCPAILTVEVSKNRCILMDAADVLMLNRRTVASLAVPVNPVDDQVRVS